ncbi:MAG: LysR substrate-binding domain-containing protein [Comamonas sp.]
MSVPLTQLPSLDLVRGFVAVGRRMSITLAADDLCVTQSAVSRQVRALEEALGVPLLVRGHRSIAFTPEGERLFRSADSAVRQLQDVVGVLGSQRGQPPVTLSASIGFTSLWLLPRLGRLQQQWPGLDLRVAADNQVLDLASLRHGGIDLAIRYCAEREAPEGALRLFGETLVPIAHPSLQIGRLDSPEALAGQVLLELDLPQRRWLHWADWLAALGLRDARPQGMLLFNQYDQLVQAAIAGQGIAIGRYELVAPLLADGRLVAVGPPGLVASPYSHWLLPASPEPSEAARKVIDWIRAEARGLAPLPPVRVHRR